MMGNSESDSWSQVYSEIKRNHDAAYQAIDEAIKLEEDEKPYDAIEKYKLGISYIDKALNIPIECPSNPGMTWERARVMIQKMKKSRAEVLTRINTIQSSDEFIAPVPPPSYDEAMSTTSSDSSGDRPRTYTELAQALEALKIEERSGRTEIIFEQDHVKFYLISPDGTVSSSAELKTLKIGIVEDVIEENPPVSFLQVGDWIYPLVPGVSPCYRTEYGAFILPDLHSETPGSSVGIILPSDVDAQFYELLEDILHGIVTEQPISGRARREIGLDEKISRGIITGASYIQQGLIKGAEKAGDLMNYATPKLLNHMKAANEEKPIPGRVQKGFEVAQNVTSTAVNVTGYVATKVGCATMALGKFLAPHIQKQGTRLLTTGFGISENEASNKMEGVLTVAAGAVEGFSTVYKGLETSASILGNNLTNNTVRIVEHKYGHPSGVLAENTLHTVGNLVTVSHNIHYVTPRGIAKHTVKDTGKAIVEDQRNNLARRSNGNLYPDLGPSTSIDHKN